MSQAEKENNQPQNSARAADYLLTAEGWSVALVLIILSFVSYYLYLYPRFIDHFYGQYWIFQSITSDQKCVEDKCVQNSNLNISIRIPKYVSEFQVDEIEIRIQNMTENPLKGALILDGEIVETYIQTNSSCKNYQPIQSTEVSEQVLSQSTATADGSENQVQITPDPTENELAAQDFIYFKNKNKNIDEELPAHYQYITYDLPAHGTQINTFTYKMHIYGPKMSASYNLRNEESLYYRWSNNHTCDCFLPETEKPENQIYICSTIDAFSTLKISAVQNLLLPPWTNILIPLYILALVWFVDRISCQTNPDEKYDRSTLKGFLAEFGILLIKSLLVVGLISGAILYVLLDMQTNKPGQTSWVIFGLLCVIVLFVFVIIVAAISTDKLKKSWQSLSQKIRGRMSDEEFECYINETNAIISGLSEPGLSELKIKLENEMISCLKSPKYAERAKMYAPLLAAITDKQSDRLKDMKNKLDDEAQGKGSSMTSYSSMYSRVYNKVKSDYPNEPVVPDVIGAVDKLYSPVSTQEYLAILEQLLYEQILSILDDADQWARVNPQVMNEKLKLANKNYELLIENSASDPTLRAALPRVKTRIDELQTTISAEVPAYLSAQTNLNEALASSSLTKKLQLLKAAYKTYPEYPALKEMIEQYQSESLSDDILNLKDQVGDGITAIHKQLDKQLKSHQSTGDHTKDTIQQLGDDIVAKLDEIIQKLPPK